MVKSEKLCLIVDDQEFDRRMMRRVFTKEYPDFPMVIACDLAQARKKLLTSKVSIVFLDNALPDGFGVDFVHELAQKDAFKRVPFVIVSDFPTPFMYAKARASNVREIWSKQDFNGPSLQRVMQQHTVLN
ncbi:response regulator [Sagittula sp. NFXS13]|uniref:Response regulator RpfG family c-di-GMP phosphodiesterase n=1 Tax=Sagittula marina TaxID=943940 RepID=A0A7W6DKP9_9RHOB|nr:response regulator [Sagittula marina]MBB3985015.1 response regulator RpfG family c-di-GMP phosphodiesterase [Sagittula marina]